MTVPSEKEKIRALCARVAKAQGDDFLSGILELNQVLDQPFGDDEQQENAPQPERSKD